MGRLFCLKESVVRTKEQDRERKRLAYAADPEARAKDAARKKQNAEWSILSRAKRRAALKGVPFDLTTDDFDIPTHCPALGIPISVIQDGTKGPKDNSISLDRIIPALGYVRGNVAIISLKANRIKNNGTSDELRAIADWIDGL